MGTHHRSLASGEERTGDCDGASPAPAPGPRRSPRAILAQKSKPWPQGV